MPELPEIAVRAKEMNQELAGKTIADIEVLQPKCLNVSKTVFIKSLVNAKIQDVTYRGKWLLVETSKGWLLISLGMGGEILLVTRSTLPDKYRLVFDFHDQTCLAVNFWWFGYAHYAKEIKRHSMISKLGPNALDISLDAFRNLLHNRRGGIKSFLLNQQRIAGIGNVYVQDPLFKAGIHPLCPINTLNDQQINMLWRSIREVMQESIDCGGSFWEVNLYGKRGKWDDRNLLVGYKEGKPCPECGTTIEKIKTGSTASYICPECQPIV